MAWISIHEQVMGGKLRNLAKAIGCSQNEALGILVRLWLWGINNAKKDGEIIGADKEDIADVLTVGLEKKILPKKVVDALIETNWIDYKGNYYIHDWSEWQGQWYKALESREKATERKRKERARKGNEQLAPEIETKEKPYDVNFGVEVESQKAETSTKSESKEKIYNDYDMKLKPTELKIEIDNKNNIEYVKKEIHKKFDKNIELEVQVIGEK